MKLPGFLALWDAPKPNKPLCLLLKAIKGTFGSFWKADGGVSGGGGLNPAGSPGLLSASLKSMSKVLQMRKAVPDSKVDQKKKS